MKSKTLSINNSLRDLYSSKVSKTVQKLEEAGIITIEDLLWVFPLRIQKVPPVQDFSEIKNGQLFQGKASIISVQARPSFQAKRSRAYLQNVTVIVQDDLSDQTFTLQWFNAYSNLVKKLKSLSSIHFLGPVTNYKDRFQIVAPQIIEEETAQIGALIIQYPTINGVTQAHLKSVLKKIPEHVIDEIEDPIPHYLLNSKSLLKLSETFKIMHGICNEWTDQQYNAAEERLIYQEFFEEQLKVNARRKLLTKEQSFPMKIDENWLTEFKNIFPYPLTTDQELSLEKILMDFEGDHPMMRLIQGDVGCGKTTVAIITALFLIRNKKQVAFMCPTEALALQHYQTVSEVLKHQDITIGILLGSHTLKEKKQITQKLQNGEINFIIGTHTLFQESVFFKDLGLVIIDEQHKFGVKQRLKLLQKGKATHSLILTATPIPRSLSLTQYGDLDVSVIKEKPLGRKEIKTRIVHPDNYNNYLSFLKTRIELGEQAYIVVPAIDENEDTNFRSVEEILLRFRGYFPQLSIEPLHGRMKQEEKEIVLNSFRENKVNILISTSVIEVGIDVHNATVMSIINPERFGLSSLHQLRGRVGRGGKPGFCFLVIENELSQETLERVSIIEKTNDGFEISEHDLEIRGEGDLFGTGQSGVDHRRIANLVKHKAIFEEVYSDVTKLLSENNPDLIQRINKYQERFIITKTI